MQTIRLIVFPAGFNWPVWVAREQGWFEREAIDVVVSPTPGSVVQMTGLIEGRFDIALTLADNVVAYREGQGEVPIRGDDLVAFMGADARVLPALVTLPQYRSYDDLRGQVLSVDALATGLAPVLRALLARGGLSERDYTLVSVGGAKERFEALLRGEHAGALFNAPFEGALRARGFNVLDSAESVAPRYQNHVGAARLGWAQAHRAAVVGFIRAYVRAVNWLYQPIHREAAFSIYQRNMPGADASAAATAFGILFDADRGFPRDGAIDMQGLAQVVGLRARYGRPPKVLNEPAAYVDASFLVEAACPR